MHAMPIPGMRATYGLTVAFPGVIYSLPSILGPFVISKFKSLRMEKVICPPTFDMHSSRLEENRVFKNI